jgi:glycosyltransferase involved in cell wall biosynthesis
MHKHLHIALLCYYTPDSPPSIHDSLEYYSWHSSHTVHIYNLASIVKKGQPLRMPPEFQLGRYHAILLHNSMSYFPVNIETIVNSLRLQTSTSLPALLLFRQDENNELYEFRKTLANIEFDHIFTCLPSSDIPAVYGMPIKGRTTFSRLLTGYIHPRLAEVVHPSYKDRSIDIGYRGSVQPLSFGRLAYEKYTIATSVLSALGDTELHLDISGSWSDRLGPDQWISFLLNCKSTLGVESGASVFDLDNTLDKLIDSANKSSPYDPGTAEHAEHILASIQHLEDNVRYRQVSPRHLEAACCKTLQILFPGSYSDIFRPYEHYLPLERDLSNLSDIIRVLRCPDKVSQIVERAYRQIALNPDYSLQKFTQIVDAGIIDTLSKLDIINADLVLPAPACEDQPTAHGFNICAHKLTSNHRISWISDFSPNSYSISQVGINRWSDITSYNNASHFIRVNLPLDAFEKDFLDQLRVDCAAKPGHLASLLLDKVLLIYESLQWSGVDFCRHYGISSTSGREPILRSRLQHILNTCRTLFCFLSSLSDCSFIIASDLDALIPALLFKALRGTPVFYDAHEFWPENDSLNSDAEIRFWIYLEYSLVPWCDYRQTVSPSLSNHMSTLYGCKFESIPNAIPLSKSPSHLYSTHLSESIDTAYVRFIYHGNYDPCRGLDLLINAWRELPDEAVLCLRGPAKGDYRDYLLCLAKKNKSLGRNVFFLPSINEELPIAALSRDGDVGIIPCAPILTNHRNDYPDEFFHYMAAGLPILTNTAGFIPEFLSLHQLGWSVDFSNSRSFLQVIHSILDSKQSFPKIGKRAKQVHHSVFNWEAASSKLYEAIYHSVQPSAPSSAIFVYDIPGPLLKTCPLVDSPTPRLILSIEGLKRGLYSSIRFLLGSFTFIIRRIIHHFF